ncbi:S-adenosyl-L-methionine-dependent methyltransferase [Exidia glandulosa HHB12029]|uniref:S-adenosyl-L-methionine-dependent methyltransferase n=1 Tax=Exidia glandulosa HHB12029 TaxID=1314781 RepID=A0A165L786_EXIGL|nr:S-adenosyl-L-methionine-dependent methyltransferase [Exidia glandulosa HHB12029]
MNFYFEAAGVLDRLEERKTSVKSLLGSLPAQNRKRVTALVLQTLKYKPTLNEIIGTTKLLQLEKRAFPGSARNTAIVLVHDLLFAKGGIQAGDGPLKQAILRHKTRLHAELTKLKVKRGARTNEDLVQLADPRAAKIPRYVRVNALKTSLDDALADLNARGFSQGDTAEGKKFVQDPHVPNLLAFDAARTEMSSDPAYLRGELILQDKASCFPALVLNPPAHADANVIDATAAPGNKTTHLAALMQNRGTLFAFERDKRRFKTLETMLARAGASNVRAQNADFLSVDPHDATYARVSHILLDPSCSGSGIVNRLDYLLDDAAEEQEEERDERLEKLAAFQQSMIAHAMKFPSVSRIVYSTCSVHAAENERVVRAALLASSGAWVLAPRDQVLPTWERRGVQDELGDVGDAANLVRCMPGEDATNGFFVSCFERAPATGQSAIKRKLEADDDLDHKPTAKKRKKKKKKKTNAAGDAKEDGNRGDDDNDEWLGVAEC